MKAMIAVLLLGALLIGPMKQSKADEPNSVFSPPVGSIRLPKSGFPEAFWIEVLGSAPEALVEVFKRYSVESNGVHYASCYYRNREELYLLFFTGTEDAMLVKVNWDENTRFVTNVGPLVVNDGKIVVIGGQGGVGTYELMQAEAISLLGREFRLSFSFAKIFAGKPRNRCQLAPSRR